MPQKSQRFLVLIVFVLQLLFVFLSKYNLIPVQNGQKTGIIAGTKRIDCANCHQHPSKQIMLVNAALLMPKGKTEPIGIRSLDGKKMLIYTNIKNIWRYDTRGNYWICYFDLKGETSSKQYFSC